MIAVVYAVLACIATLINIGAQEGAMRVYDGPFAIPLSMVFGTGVGLVAKYVLDKRYIFRFRARDAVHDGKTFFLYTIMGLATTVVFWAFEAGFDHVFGTRTMRYAGATLGLAIGYAIKYQLDKRFVFRNGAGT